MGGPIRCAVALRDPVAERQAGQLASRSRRRVRSGRRASRLCLREIRRPRCHGGCASRSARSGCQHPLRGIRRGARRPGLRSRAGQAQLQSRALRCRLRRLPRSVRAVVIRRRPAKRRGGRFMASSSVSYEAVFRIAFGGFEARIVDVKRRAVGAEDLIVLAHVEIDMRDGRRAAERPCN